MHEVEGTLDPEPRTLNWFRAGSRFILIWKGKLGRGA